MNPDVIADTDRLTSMRVPLVLDQSLPAPEPDDQFYRPPLDQGVSTATGVSFLPWRPIQVPGTRLIGISPVSYVLPTSSITAIAITGLLASTAPTMSDPNAFICPSIGGGVWLKLDLTGGANPGDIAGGGKVEHGNTLWTGHPSPKTFVSDGGFLRQDAYYLLLAKVESPSSDRTGVFTIDFGGGDVRKVVQWYDENVVARLRNDSATLVVEPVNPALLYYDA